MPSKIRLRMFGKFGATTVPENQQVMIAAPRLRALVAILALQPGHAETRERVATLLWADSGDRLARHSLRQGLSVLRKELGGAGINPLKGDRHTIELDPNLIAVDALEFLALAKSDCETDLEQAAGLYQGPLLDGLNIDVEPFEEWLRRERARFLTAASHVFEKCARLRDQANQGEAAISAAERTVSLDPANEAAQRLLIELMARHRGRSAALAHAEVAAQFLRDEFGSEPEAETIDLIKKIRTSPATPIPSVAATPRGLLPTGEPQAIVAESTLDDASRGPAGPTATILVGRAPSSDQSQHDGSKGPRVPSYAKWAATGVAVALGIAVTVVSLQTLNGRKSPAADTSAHQASQSPPVSSPSAVVAKAVEDKSSSAIIVLPLSATPPDSAPAVRLAEIISNDLINDLSRVPSFRVIARSTSMQYVARPVDVAALGTDLGVNYVVEGDVRLEDQKVRINIALIDVRSRLQVWTNRYERDESELLSVQDEIARALARQLHVGIMEVGGQRDNPNGPETIKGKLTRGWAALNLFAFYRGGKEGGQLFQEVLDADPQNLSALMGLGAFKSTAAVTGQTTSDPVLLLDQADSLLKRAMEIEPRASLPYYFLGRVAMYRGDPDQAIAMYNKTLELNPGYAPAYGTRGYVLSNTGHLNEALEDLKYAVRLSPKDHYLGQWSHFIGRIYFELGDDEQAEHWLSESVRLVPNWPLSRAGYAAFLAEHGDLAEARAQASELGKLDPKMGFDGLVQRFTLLCKEEGHRPKRLLAGLRKAMAIVHEQP